MFLIVFIKYRLVTFQRTFYFMLRLKAFCQMLFHFLILYWRVLMFTIFYRTSDFDILKYAFKILIKILLFIRLVLAGWTAVIPFYHPFFDAAGAKYLLTLYATLWLKN
jgi:hypothetical protein